MRNTLILFMMVVALSACAEKGLTLEAGDENSRPHFGVDLGPGQSLDIDVGDPRELEVEITYTRELNPGWSCRVFFGHDCNQQEVADMSQ